MSSKPQPSPCPFCGSDDVILNLVNDPEVAITCNHCMASGPVAGNDDLAVEMWNERNDGTESDSW